MLNKEKCFANTKFLLKVMQAFDLKQKTYTCKSKFFISSSNLGFHHQLRKYLIGFYFGFVKGLMYYIKLTILGLWCAFWQILRSFQ